MTPENYSLKVFTFENSSIVCFNIQMFYTKNLDIKIFLTPLQIVFAGIADKHFF